MIGDADGDDARKGVLESMSTAFEHCASTIQGLQEDVQQTCDALDSHVAAEAAAQLEQRRAHLEGLCKDALIEIQSLVASFEAAHNDLDADQESLDAYRAEAKEIEEDIGALATDERILDKEERVIALASRVSEFKALTDQRLAALKAEMKQQRAEAAQAEQEWMQRVAAIRDAWSRVQEDVHTRLRTLQRPTLKRSVRAILERNGWSKWPRPKKRLRR